MEENQAKSEENLNNGQQQQQQPQPQSDENRDQRERDRRGRGQRGTRFSDADTGGNRERSRERRNCRIYISNIPYDYRWQDLKDLFRKIVGNVEYVELFSDENGKARGCGIVEFKDPESVDVALEKMNRYEINGREIVVKEDHGENRDQYGRIIREGGMGGGGGGGSGGGGGGGGGGIIGGGGGGGGGVRDRRSGGHGRQDFRDDDRISGGRHMGMGGGSIGGGVGAPNDYDMQPYNTYGLSTSFLESLGINGPLHNKIFVANLDYKVDTKKLKQVFKLAGKVQSVDLSVDKEGNSRGFAVIEYDHPVEAVQAISMFDRQMLYDRRMTVRLDRIPDKGEGIKLPEGLGGIGIGLGPNGEPLRDVARNLPNAHQQQQMSQYQMPPSAGNLGGPNLIGGSSGGSMNLNSVPVPVAPPPLNGPPGGGLQGPPGSNSGPSQNLLSNAALAANAPNMLSNLSSSNLAALSNVVGGLKNLAGVAGNALTNPLLASSLSSLGLNISGGAGSVASAGDNDTPVQTPIANNYSTGNSYNSGYTSTTFNSSQRQSSGQSDYDQQNLRGYTTQSQAGSDFSSGQDMYGTGNGGAALGSGRKSDTIIIKNIPLSCTWQTLRDKFRDIGEVKFAEIRGNDVGVVRFFKEKDAELAIKLMDGSRMDGRTVTVSFF